MKKLVIVALLGLLLSNPKYYSTDKFTGNFDVFSGNIQLTSNTDNEYFLKEIDKENILIWNENKKQIRLLNIVTGNDKLILDFKEN